MCQKSENEKDKGKKHGNIDLIILLSILTCALLYSGVVYGQIEQMSNQAEGEDVDIYITSGGFAFQDGNNPSSFIALYNYDGNLNTSSNEFYVGPQGGGMFTFLSNESFTLQFLMSVAANMQGDSGNAIRNIPVNSNGLSGNYTVEAGNQVTIYWAPTIDYPYALPIVSFWGMAGGALLGCVFTGWGIRRKQFKILFLGAMCFLAAFVFYIVFTNL